MILLHLRSFQNFISQKKLVYFKLSKIQRCESNVAKRDGDSWCMSNSWVAMCHASTHVPLIRGASDGIADCNIVAAIIYLYQISAAVATRHAREAVESGEEHHQH